MNNVLGEHTAVKFFVGVMASLVVIVYKMIQYMLEQVKQSIKWIIIIVVLVIIGLFVAVVRSECIEHRVSLQDKFDRALGKALGDIDGWGRCLSGPNMVPPTVMVPLWSCLIYDRDCDGDVDLKDWANVF